MGSSTDVEAVVTFTSAALGSLNKRVIQGDTRGRGGVASHPDPVADRDPDHRLRPDRAGCCRVEAAPRPAMESPLAVPGRWGTRRARGRGRPRLGQCRLPASGRRRVADRLQHLRIGPTCSSPLRIGLVATAALLGSAATTLTVGFLAPRYDLRTLLSSPSLSCPLSMRLHAFGLDRGDGGEALEELDECVDRRRASGSGKQVGSNATHAPPLARTSVLRTRTSVLRTMREAHLRAC
jgi:hypothetical protein